MNKTRLENIFAELVVVLLPRSKESIRLVKELYDEILNYKNIEEELGVELVTLFKASEDGFYMINEGEIKFVHQGYQFNLRGHYIHLNGGYKKLDFKLKNEPFSDVLLFKDYGKKGEGGWALTEEELK